MAIPWQCRASSLGFAGQAALCPVPGAGDRSLVHQDDTLQPYDHSSSSRDIVERLSPWTGGADVSTTTMQLPTGTGPAAREPVSGQLLVRPPIGAARAVPH